MEDNVKYTNVRFKRANPFDKRAEKILDSLCAASGKSQNYVIKELLIRYGTAALHTPVFNLDETGLCSSQSQPKPANDGGLPDLTNQF